MAKEKQYEIEYKGYTMYVFRNKRGDYFVREIVNNNKDYIAKIIPPNNCALTLKGIKMYGANLIDSDLKGGFYTGSHFNH